MQSFRRLFSNRKARTLMMSFCFLAVIALTGFGFYLNHLYGQLERTFTRQEEFIPTRIYSDVSKISAPQLRSSVEERLQSLNYAFEATEEAIEFTLHKVDYPGYLIPEGHPMLDAENQTVTLSFSGDDSDAVLQAVQLNGQEVSEIFLEPELVATLSRDRASQIRDPLKFQEIPSPVWKAIISIEDQHFLEHKGFDPRGIARAMWVNLKTLSFAQGGSTITQQLVKNLMARRTKNVFQKFSELFLAFFLEIRFEKEEILERYLNEVYLGQVGSLEVHGVSEGAQHFFGKELEDLNLAETAMMAGLIRGPGYYSPYRHYERAFERTKLVLKKMVETGHIAQAEADAALQLAIRIAPPRNVANKAPYFTDFVKAELIRLLKDRFNETEVTSQGFRIYTTLDMSVSAAAQKAVAEGTARIEERAGGPLTERLEAALAAVDHNTGYIRALIGGKNYSESNFNRVLNMKRQVGSTFKPFVYLAAFEAGRDSNGVPYGPGYPVEDAPWKLTYDQGRQTWEPRNYEKKHLGWISLRTALAHSVNTVAARLGVEVGIDRVIEVSRKLGIESDLPAVPSLSLGVAELSPVELLRAYAIIANRGKADELTVIRGIAYDDGTNFARFIYHPAQVISPGSADLLTDMMETVFTEGTARGALGMGFDRVAAGKTGTTSHYRDSWFAGYTPHLTTVVWVGLDQNRTLSEGEKKKTLLLTGSNAALPIWVDFMKSALESEPPTQFPLSSNVAQVLIDRKTGRLAKNDCPTAQTVVEKYVSGFEPVESTCATEWPASQPATTLEY